MAQDHKEFPYITMVAQIIYLDNGKINRTHGEESFLEDLDYILGGDGVYYDDLKALDDWLSTLTKEEREILAAGEQSEMEEIQSRAPNPDICAGLFDDIFNA